MIITTKRLKKFGTIMTDIQDDYEETILNKTTYDEIHREHIHYLRGFLVYLSDGALGCGMDYWIATEVVRQTSEWVREAAFNINT